MTAGDPPEQTPPPSGQGTQSGGSEGTRRRLLAEAVRYSRLPLKDLWLYYFSLGGSAGEYELDAYINASYFLPALQHDILAQAVNEMIDSLPDPPRAPLSDDPLDDSFSDAHRGA